MTITECSPDLKSFSFRESKPRSFRARPIGVTTPKKTSVKRILETTVPNRWERPKPQNGHRLIKLRKRHVYHESDDRYGNKSFPFESGAEEQKQKHHGHAGVFALLFRDGPLKRFGDDVFHGNSVLTNDAAPTLLVHLDQFPVDEFH